MSFHDVRSPRLGLRIALAMLVPAFAGLPTSAEAQSGPTPETLPPAAITEESLWSNEGLTMSRAVACRSITGFENFEILPFATLTADEKLLIYYRPLRYQVARLGNLNHIHLTQDGQIRRRGEKSVLVRKEKLLDYEFKDDAPVGQVYLRNTISLKGLKPGEYEFDIILHDKLTKSNVARQTLLFRVVAADLPKEDESTDPANNKAQSRSKPSSRFRRASRLRNRRSSRTR